MHLISAGINNGKSRKTEETCDWKDFGFFSASSNPTKVPYDMPCATRTGYLTIYRLGF
jgi:hypothetical protein